MDSLFLYGEISHGHPEDSRNIERYLRENSDKIQLFILESNDNNELIQGYLTGYLKWADFLEKSKDRRTKHWKGVFDVIKSEIERGKKISVYFLPDDVEKRMAEKLLDYFARCKSRFNLKSVNALMAIGNGHIALYFVEEMVLRSPGDFTNKYSPIKNLVKKMGPSFASILEKKGIKVIVLQKSLPQICESVDYFLR